MAGTARHEAHVEHFSLAVQADRRTLEILFLGTGAALPSKYRNVTATYLHLFDKVCSPSLSLHKPMASWQLTCLPCCTEQAIWCVRPYNLHMLSWVSMC